MKNRYFSGLLSYICFLLLTTTSSLFAQPKHLQFKHLTSDDGLSSSVILSIFQDYRGFVWIGTDDGLNRYDGFNFTIYKNIPSDSSSLDGNNIMTMFEDSEKNLFIGTQNGLSLYDRTKDRFLNYMLDNASPLKGITCDVLKIREDSTGNKEVIEDYIEILNLSVVKTLRLLETLLIISEMTLVA